MGIFSWLFAPARKPEVHTPLRSQRPTDPVHIAPGRGYTTPIVGESHYQEVLDEIVGGKCEQGCKFDVTAQLVFDTGNSHDPNAIGVLISGKVVGFISREGTASMRAEILRVNTQERPITCDARIVGGWRYDDGDEGSYGVKLSISKPMRLDQR
jgi:hypothetical protein